MIEIIPAIIPVKYLQIEEDVSRVNDFVHTVQIDVMDGAYVPVTSWPYNKIDAVKFRDLIDQRDGFPFWESIEYEIDMMVCDPEEKIDDWINAGARTLIIHRESVSDESLERIFERGAAFGVDIALALKPSTTIDEIDVFAGRSSFIQCMGNDRIGFHGVEFDEAVLEKIGQLKARFDDIAVGVDIGVNEHTAPGIVKAGATRLVSGSAIFESTDIAQTIQTFQSLT